MEKMNEAVCINNCFTSNGGGKRPVKPFKRKEFWKCIGCIFLYLNTLAWGGGSVDYIHYSFEEILVAYGVDETVIR